MSNVPGRFLVVAILLCGAAAAVSAGGWSIITIDDFPDYASTERPLTLTFSVRQHGNRLVSGLKPVVRASTESGLEVAAAATPTTRDGEYAATLRLATPGDWTLRVDGGFNPGDTMRQSNAVTLPPLRVIGGGSATLTYSEAERGARLFVAKGCIGCHTPGQRLDVRRKPLAAGYLRTFLADPGVRTVDMPDLRLKTAEISALIAFINGAVTPPSPAASSASGTTAVPRAAGR